MRIFGNRVERNRGKWALWRWHDIELDGEKYLTRLQIFKTPFLSAKLHWIHRPDPDRDLHDHPWPFMSFVINGGYTELESKRPATGEVRELEIRNFNYKNTTTAHRIAYVLPRTLTFILTGPRSKSWGFYDTKTNEFTDWKEYERL